MFKRILVATDGSALSDRALDGAISLAVAHSSKLVALMVVHRPHQNYSDGVSVVGREDNQRMQSSAEERAQLALNTAVAKAAESDVDLQPDIVVADSIGDTILDAAHRHNSDVIVMASHGRRGLARLVLGSETQHVLAHTTLPVLVVR